MFIVQCHLIQDGSNNITEEPWKTEFARKHEPSDVVRAIPTSTAKCSLEVDYQLNGGNVEYPTFPQSSILPIVRFSNLKANQGLHIRQYRRNDLQAEHPPKLQVCTLSQTF